MQSVPPPPPSSKSTSDVAPRRNTARRLLIVVVLLVAAFLGGFVPQWLEARRLRAELERTDLQLRLANAHRVLGVASHEAMRNNYANAADAAGRFFDQTATLVRLEGLEKDEPRRAALASYSARRDEIMVLLNAGDPASREKLSGLFLAMDGVLGQGMPDSTPR